MSVSTRWLIAALAATVLAMLGAGTWFYRSQQESIDHVLGLLPRIVGRRASGDTRKPSPDG
jgi:hypothetical protein